MIKFFKWLLSIDSNAVPVIEAEVVEAPKPLKRQGVFSTHDVDDDRPDRTNLHENVLQPLRDKRPSITKGAVNRALRDNGEAFAMDSCDSTDPTDGDDTAMGYEYMQPNVSDQLALWYATNSFIGHQLAAIIAQHWLILKACSMPGDDAIRKGYNIVSADGDPVDKEVLKLMKRADKKYDVNAQLREWVTFGRVFGIRIMLFKIEYDGMPDDYYEKPFNIDSIKPGSYKGMTQIDPYWCAPELDAAASSVPQDQHFYEPTWWNISGKRYHRTHLVIFRNGCVADILKPSYLYGGIPVPQQIMERVYGAERTANEAPLLALTKRTAVYSTDASAILENFTAFAQKMLKWARFWNNTGIRVIDKESDAYNQYDTSLADLDVVIMSQFQLVAAGARVPGTKLLGTAPKGFNATGEFDESSYHEDLESLQANDLTRVLDRHHALTIASDVRKQLPSLGEIMTTVSFLPLDSMTETELAEVNLKKAQTDQIYSDLGAVDSVDVRERLIHDKDSGYVDLPPVERPDQPLTGIENGDA